MLLSSFSSFAAIVCLLTLFWVVFAIIGLHVFGGVINDPMGFNFPNFNTFMNSLVLTFNVRASMWAGGVWGGGGWSAHLHLCLSVSACAWVCVPMYVGVGV